MEHVSTKVNDFDVTFYEGVGRNVEVHVNGECQETGQSTWFFHALLEEALRLKKENQLLRSTK